jgi:hypothetical protein
MDALSGTSGSGMASESGFGRNMEPSPFGPNTMMQSAVSSRQSQPGLSKAVSAGHSASTDCHQVG